jgi:pyruvate/2-oxoglutarate dehydrogenase complex dihydrolipoamide dehydrogenase (E3) component
LPSHLIVIGGGYAGLELSQAYRRCAQATGEREGFMKVLVAENDDRVFGFTMIGAAAGEVVAVVQMAMLTGAPYERLANAILAHPTMAEGLGMLFSNVPRRSLHHATSETAA